MKLVSKTDDNPRENSGVSSTSLECTAFRLTIVFIHKYHGVVMLTKEPWNLSSPRSDHIIFLAVDISAIADLPLDSIFELSPKKWLVI